MEEVRFTGGEPRTPAAPLDLLCLAPHPDDAELGMGGTLCLHAARGWRVGVLDLTRGELASNGSPEERLAESAVAAEVLGLCWRANLGLADRNLQAPGAVARLAAAIRAARPRVLCLPSADDPHPDHGAARALALEAVFSAGLRRYAPAPEGEPAGPPFRPRAVLEYFINGWREPALVVDVSAVYERKRASLAAHQSQFAPAAAGAAPTRLTSGAAVAQVEARDRYLGAQAGVTWAEGFRPVQPLGVADLDFLRGPNP